MATDPAPVQRPATVPVSAPAVTGARPRRWPWVVAAATLVVFAVGNLLYPSEDAEILFTVMFSAIIGAFVLVGALLAVRVPSNPIGPMLLASGAVLATTIAVGTLALVGAAQGTVPVELLAIAVIVNDAGFYVPIMLIMVGIPLVFPDGRLLSRRWRLVVALLVFGMIAVVLGQLLGPGPLGEGEMPNPFAVPALFGLAALLDTLASLTVIGFVLAVLAVVLRYRRGDEVERHQLKWLIAVALVAAVVFPIALLVPEGVVSQVALWIGLGAVFALPMAIAVAILRYRLYDIDRIISRTIAWAIISGLLAVAFVGLVVGLTTLLERVTQGETLAVAAATLVAATLFQPLRRRVQRAVDRRFDRARYDAQHTADAFAERVRDEVDLDSLAGELERTVVGAMRPTSAAIWLPRRDVA